MSNLKLHKKSRCFAIVINSKELENEDLILVDLEIILNNLIRYISITYEETFVAGIIHSKDINEDGTLKRSHLHIVLRYVNQTTASSVMTELKEVLNINENQISIVPSDCVEHSTQYLIHKNDFTKYQYKKIEILSNNLDRLNYYLEKNDLDIEQLIELIYQGSSLKEISLTIGLKDFRKYIFVIKELRKEFIENNGK